MLPGAILAHSALARAVGVITGPAGRGRSELGGRQAGKAPGFGPGIRRFESFPPSPYRAAGGVTFAVLTAVAV